MAELVFKNAYVKFGTSAAPTTTLLARVKTVRLNLSVEALDRTGMTSSGRKRIAGLKDGGLTVDYIADYADNMVDEKISDMWGLTSSNCWWEVRPTTAARSASNPAYVGKFVMTSFTPASGGVGELGMFSCTLVADGAISRKTA